MLLTHKIPPVATTLKLMCVLPDDLLQTNDSIPPPSHSLIAWLQSSGLPWRYCKIKAIFSRVMCKKIKLPLFMSHSPILLQQVVICCDHLGNSILWYGINGSCCSRADENFVLSGARPFSEHKVGVSLSKFIGLLQAGQRLPQPEGLSDSL